MSVIEMTIEDLPHLVLHAIEFDDGTVVKYPFFLSINRDRFGKWSAGYVKYAEDDEEMAIPQLVFNGADNLQEVAARMSAKLERYRRRFG